MKAIKVEGETRCMGRPSGTLEEDCEALSIQDAHDPIWGNVMRSAWLPDAEERAAIAAGAPVILQIVGRTHPVVAMYAGGWTNPDQEVTNKPKPKGGI